jgi:hypothetical protein
MLHLRRRRSKVVSDIEDELDEQVDWP